MNTQSKAEVNTKKMNKSVLLLTAYFVPLAAIMYHCTINGFSADHFLTYRDQMQMLAATNRLLSAVIFLVVYFVIVLSSAPFTVVMNLFAGYLFGSLLGALLANAAVTAGSYVLFKFSHYIMQRLRGEDVNLKIFEGGTGNTALMLFFTRLSPFFPASVINMGSGAMGIKSPLFVITTFLGSLPLILAYTLIGKHLGTIVQISDIYDQNLTILLVSLGLLSFSPLLKKDIRTMLAQKYRQPIMSLLAAPTRVLQTISKKSFGPILCWRQTLTPRNT
jgi:uncharacterized membrane protein YdjX (TVP38/TMEM64 family)